MANIEFLTVEYNQAATQKICEIFKSFEQSYYHTVIPTFHSWESVWHALVNVGIYRRGADLAEIGTTWLDSLISMNALRPFSERDLARLGGAQSFLPSAWQHATVEGRDEVWAIPFRVDVRLVHYWKDLLEKVDVDPDTAFTSPASFKQTMAALQTILPRPFVVTTSRGAQNTVHDAASWVWANGGDFVAPDGRSVLFDQPAAIDGLCQYFDLYRYMHPGRMGTADVLNLFIQGQVAAIILGPWLRSNLEEQNRTELIPNLGISMPPGPAFMGGSVLAVWQHTRYEHEVVDLIERLISPAAQASFCPLTGLLPVRKEAWEMPEIKDDPLNRIFYQALENSRTLSRVSVWGTIEEKLKIEISQIWDEIFATPDPDVEAILKKRLVPLARRLNITLGL